MSASGFLQDAPGDLNLVTLVDLANADASCPDSTHVHNSHMLTQNLYNNYYYPKPKYELIGYWDPLGPCLAREASSRGLGTCFGFWLWGCCVVLCWVTVAPVAMLDV